MSYKSSGFIYILLLVNLNWKISIKNEKKPGILRSITVVVDWYLCSGTTKHGRETSYAVVPDQDRYMSGPLGIHIYPTHLIINKKGMTVKEVTDAEDMIRALNKVL